MSRGPWRSSGSPHKQEQEVALCSDKASSNIHQEQLQQPEVSSTAKSLQVTGLSGLILWGLPVGCKCYTMGGLASVSCPFLLPSSGGCCQASSLSKAILLIYHSQTIERLYFGGVSKITADGDCSHEIKRYLLLGRKTITNLDSILKSRDITLPTKVHLVKAMVFPVVMYGCESWNIKKAEHLRIDAFEMWCWRRLLRVPWIPRRSNQSILKEISPEYSLEGLMLKLKLQYFGHLM